MTPSPVRWSAVSTELRDYWTPYNTDAKYSAPRLNTSAPTGDFGLYDGSFLRLKTAEIAYDFPEKWMRAVKLSNMRMYVNGNNLLFWSDLPMDTETGTFDIQNAYPMLRQINIGIDIGL
jgi:hypothetical protein